MGLFQRLVDNSDAGSLATRLRRRRFGIFLQLLEGLPRPVRILDVGGTQKYWEMMDLADRPNIEVTLLNLVDQEVRGDRFKSLVGDARDMRGIGDAAFDVAFSNSVIEHVGDYSEQKAMASEIRRVARRFYVQTPNYMFPLEPHFLVPGFQWLPVEVRAWLINRRRLGWIERIPDRDEACAFVRSVRLLRRSEMEELFPGATIYEENVLGLTKSFVAYGGRD